MLEIFYFASNRIYSAEVIMIIHEASRKDHDNLVVSDNLLLSFLLHSYSPVLQASQVITLLRKKLIFRKVIVNWLLGSMLVVQIITFNQIYCSILSCDVGNLLLYVKYRLNDCNNY